MDDSLMESFRKLGLNYVGTADKEIDVFERAFSMNDEKTMRALLFPGSPILSAEISEYKMSYLHFIHGTSATPDMSIIQLLIDLGMDVDKKDARGQTPLDLTVSRSFRFRLPDPRDMAMIRLLLRNGASREIRNNYGLTSLQHSLYIANLNLIEEFLKTEYQLPNVNELSRIERRRHVVNCLLSDINDWNVPGNYSLLLHFLIHENDDETFEDVAKNTTFNVNTYNHKGLMLLHVAAIFGTARMIKVLADLGADLDACTKSDENNETPFILALKNRRIENAHCLLDCGASVNNKNPEQQEGSPLHCAVFVQNIEIVEKLLNMGADVNASSYDCTPLLFACSNIIGQHHRKWSHTSLVNAFEDLDFNIGESPSCEKIVESLIDHGANIEEINRLNRNSLDEACRRGKLNIVKVLLNRDAKINQGAVPTLHYAVKGQNPHIVKLILEKDADVNCEYLLINLFNSEYERRVYFDRYKNFPPITPFDYALHFISDDLACKDIIEVLIEYGVNVNAHVIDLSPSNKTPLHLSINIHKGQYDLKPFAKRSPERLATMKFLLKCNADVNAKDVRGLLPLDYAISKYYTILSHSLRTQFLESIIRSLVAFLGKMIEAREFVVEEIHESLHKYPALHSIHQNCVVELSRMKRNIHESVNFTFFDILSKDIQHFRGILENENIIQILNSGEYKKDFTEYAEYLEHRIRDAQIRLHQLELGIDLFRKYVNENFYDEMILEIFKHLNLIDLKNFAKACALSNDNVE